MDADNVRGGGGHVCCLVKGADRRPSVRLCGCRSDAAAGPDGIWVVWRAASGSAAGGLVGMGEQEWGMRLGNDLRLAGALACPASTSLARVSDGSGDQKKNNN